MSDVTENKYLTPASKKQFREELEEHIKTFLENGGKIQQIPIGATTIDMSKSYLIGINAINCKEDWPSD